MAEDQESPASATLFELREHTSRLANDLHGALRRVSVSVGDATIEVEWQPQPDQPVAAPTQVMAHLVAVDEPKQADEEHVLVRSPMVGTFYCAPSSDAPPFVEVGDMVTEGQPIAVIEAMKLFNPINSDATGVVVEVLVDDATPVEFGQPLLRVKPEES
jgi:acetyl-CoA carboxylase biotin carboxyl carrier protein